MKEAILYGETTATNPGNFHSKRAVQIKVTPSLLDILYEFLRDAALVARHVCISRATSMRFHQLYVYTHIANTRSAHSATWRKDHEEEEE